VANTTAVNSRVKTSGGSAKAGIGGGWVIGEMDTNTKAVNSYVNGIKENFGSISNDQLLCQKADPRVLTANCSPKTEFLDALDFSNSNACPVNAATVSTAAQESTAGTAAATVSTGVIASTATTASTAAKESTPTTASTAVSASTAATVAATVSTAAKESTAAVAAATVSTDATASTPTTASTAATASIPIKINDTETLGKIGRHPAYPLNGTYQQTADIDASQFHQSIGDEWDHFTGQYDGKDHTISGLSGCFVDTLEGSISNLRFTGARINSYEPAGVVACTVNGQVRNIRAEDVQIATLSNYADAGIGGGIVAAGGTVANTTAVNSKVQSFGDSSYAGIGGGWVKDGGTVANTTAMNSTVKTSGKNAHAGIGGGRVYDGGTVGNTTVVNSRVKTSGQHATAGFGGGWVFDGGMVGNTTVVNS
ncbi:hypothetical protein, partial [Endozoicomonas acroporae]|uniref:hypothetical protein n=1 Tax=Endozoicomonas acroporae TaxID=1701104 RepID=UPI0018856173